MRGEAVFIGDSGRCACPSMDLFLRVGHRDGTFENAELRQVVERVTETNRAGRVETDQVTPAHKTGSLGDAVWDSIEDVARVVGEADRRGSGIAFL